MELIKLFPDSSLRAKTVISVLFGNLVLFISSQIAFPLPYSPIPVTMQTFALFILAATLGSRLGFYAVVAYLAEGTLGLPVFAGFSSNPLWFCSLKAGYLFSFPLSVYMMGWMLERVKSYRFVLTLLVFTLGDLLVKSVGTLWISFFIGLPNAFAVGFTPFLLGAGYKIAAATCLFSSKIVERKS